MRFTELKSSLLIILIYSTNFHFLMFDCLHCTDATYNILRKMSSLFFFVNQDDIFSSKFIAAFAQNKQIAVTGCLLQQKLTELCYTLIFRDLK